MKKSLYHYTVATTFALGLFFSTFDLVFAGVVQNFLGQYLLEFESQYRDQVSGQPNNPGENYRTNLVNGLDALVTCLYQSRGSTPNWQAGGLTDQNAPTSDLITKLNQNDHPCHSEQEAVATIRDHADHDSNGKYAAVVIADRVNTLNILRRPASNNRVYDQGLSPADRDQAARQKLNAFSDCLMQSTDGRPNWQVGGSVNDRSTPAVLRSEIRRVGDAQPCRAVLETTAQHQPSTPRPTPTPSDSSSTATTTPSAASTATTSNPAPGGGTTGGGVSAPTGGNATIYTGPGFVNVTPFSVFGRVSIDRIINNVINYISGFLATIAVLSLMYGGVLYMTAGGDNAKIGKAKQVLVLTVVGLAIGSFAYMIIIFTTRLFYGA